MPLFKLKSAIRNFDPGEFRTDDELTAAGCDITWLLNAGAIEPVTGPTGDTVSGSTNVEELIAEVANLQTKYEAAESRAEAAEKRIKELEAQNTQLRTESLRHAADLKNTRENLRSVSVALAAEKASKKADPKPEPVGV